MAYKGELGSFLQLEYLAPDHMGVSGKSDVNTALPRIETDVERAKRIIGGDRGALFRTVQDIRPLDTTMHEWDGIADFYLNEYRINPFTVNAMIETPIFLMAINGHLDGANILDVGTGTGWLITKAMSTGRPNYAMGVDISSEMLKNAKRFISERNLFDRVDLINSPIEMLETEKRFSVAMALFSLENLPDLKAGLRKVFSLLEPDGWFYAMIKNPDRNKLYALAGTEEYHPGYNSWYYEKWPGTGDRGIWARYMEWDHWISEFDEAGFKTSTSVVRLSENRIIQESLKRSPQGLVVLEEALSKPPAIIISAQKKTA